MDRREAVTGKLRVSNGQVHHTEAGGNYAGESSPGLFGNTIHTGKNGEIGVTDDGAFGGKVTDIDQYDG